MINKRELRIGNLVRCLVHLPVGYYKPTMGVAEITAIRGESLETDGESHKYKDVDEVLLTDAILIKAGGKQLKKDMFVFSDENTDKLKIFLIKKSDKYYLSDDEGSILSVSLKSVHHLQNLYFDLRQEELDIDL